jgi:uncharacterized protein (DUF4415 family)
MARDRIAPDHPTDESPELDDAWFARARPAAELLPGLIGKEAADRVLARRPGQRGPQKSPTKQLVSIRLDRDVIAYFKGDNEEGWQVRLNEVLRKAAGL